MNVTQTSIFEDIAPEHFVTRGISLGGNWYSGDGHIWSRAKTSSLRIDSSIIRPGTWISMRFEVFNSSTETPKILCIRSSGHPTIERRVAPPFPAKILMRTPKDPAQSEIFLELDTLDSPSKVGVSIDERRLGIRILDVQVLAGEPKLPLEFTSSEARNIYLSSHWASPDPTGTWSIGRHAKIVLLPELRPSRGAPQLCLDFGVLPRPDDMGPLEVSVFLNDTEAARWSCVAGEQMPRALNLNNHWVAGRPLHIDFVFDSLASPLELGVNEDRRDLGIFLQRVYCR